MIYPPACIICGDLLEKGKAHICRECELGISYLSEPCCLKCGKEIQDEEEELCNDCRENSRKYIKGFPAMEYKGPIVNSIARFKYDNKKGYGAYFAGEIIKRQGKYLSQIGIDAIIPVPIHKKKLKKRGYNQAKILADELGKLLGIIVDDELIQRTVNTMPQKELDNLDREKNLRNAFISTGKIVKYKCVLLVDDIYTTGSTVEACTKVLHSMGIKDVYYTSVCIGKGY